MIGFCKIHPTICTDCAVGQYEAGYKSGYEAAMNRFAEEINKTREELGIPADWLCDGPFDEKEEEN